MFQQQQHGQQNAIKSQQQQPSLALDHHQMAAQQQQQQQQQLQMGLWQWLSMLTAAVGQQQQQAMANNNDRQQQTANKKLERDSDGNALCPACHEPIGKECQQWAQHLELERSRLRQAIQSMKAKARANNNVNTAEMATASNGTSSSSSGSSASSNADAVCCLRSDGGEATTKASTTTRQNGSWITAERNRKKKRESILCKVRENQRKRINAKLYLSLRTLVDGNNAAGIDAHQANQTDAADRQKADDANHSSAQNDGMEGKESAAEIKREWQQQQSPSNNYANAEFENDSTEKIPKSEKELALRESICMECKQPSLDFLVLNVHSKALQCLQCFQLVNLQNGNNNNKNNNKDFISLFPLPTAPAAAAVHNGTNGIVVDTVAAINGFHPPASPPTSTPTRKRISPPSSFTALDLALTDAADIEEGKAGDDNANNGEHAANGALNGNGTAADAPIALKRAKLMVEKAAM